MFLNEYSHRNSYDEFGNGADGYLNIPCDHVVRSRSQATNIPRSSQGNDRAKTIATEYGITVSTPKHHQYAIKEVRRGTFKNWPSHITQKPDELAEAGFFYTGKSDVVVCFYCGQGLHEWDVEDEPWGEHARWSPDCPFLLNIKGPEFVRLEQMKDTDPVQYVSKKTSAVQVVENRPQTQTKVSDIDTWNNPAVESLLQNGYSKESVRKAIYVLRRKRGDNVTLSAEELLSIIFNIEEGTEVCDDLSELEKEEPNDNPNDLVRKENEELRKSIYCRKCSTKVVSMVFLPCGHLCTCTDCAPSVKYCLLCEKFIKGTVRTYMV
ncbi:baculoviral IAP repeat-containing protein 8-like [Crassostrea virginica]